MQICKHNTFSASLYTPMECHKLPLMTSVLSQWEYHLIISAFCMQSIIKVVHDDTQFNLTLQRLWLACTVKPAPHCCIRVSCAAAVLRMLMQSYRDACHNAAQVDIV